jgi:exo-1,4-beta-D-glucosaminidase
VRLRVANAKDRSDVVAVFWEDNYFSLWPGEERVVMATYDAADLHGAKPIIEVSGFNVAPDDARPSAGFPAPAKP